jgi:hypothetical protein
VAHAKCAVFPDSRPRAWFADRAGTVGLLFNATLGVVDLKRPEGKACVGLVCHCAEGLFLAVGCVYPVRTVPADRRGGLCH